MARIAKTQKEEDKLRKADIAAKAEETEGKRAQRKKQ